MLAADSHILNIDCVNILVRLDGDSACAHLQGVEVHFMNIDDVCIFNCSSRNLIALVDEANHIASVCDEAHDFLFKHHNLQLCCTSCHDVVVVEGAFLHCCEHVVLHCALIVN